MREFYVDTPLGKLHVYAKLETDNPRDYPGVYVDLVSEDGKSIELLACTEYDSALDRLQTCVYQPGWDEPVELLVHETDDPEEE